MVIYGEEGQGRRDRKLAVANHKRHNGKSEFTVAQTMLGISSISDDSFLGTVTANLMGSKYHIWDQGSGPNILNKQSKSLTGVVAFIPTITTWTGSYRSIRAYVAKHQSMQLKNSTQVQHIKGLPNDWEAKREKVHQLFSRVPQYNKLSRQYELDFRDKGRANLRIQSSVKNFQLTLEENGKQTILQLGRVGKSKYVMDYRYPLTGYQAFCICLASIDSKLCCSFVWDPAAESDPGDGVEEVGDRGFEGFDGRKHGHLRWICLCCLVAPISLPFLSFSKKNQGSPVPVDDSAIRDLRCLLQIH
ncbi:hypothetical protein TIFTF001_017226 [Ficus carica]|uniref:Tubby C-terminal domain-containing protein n=1 Tax=Ficus carica TaxID=3494 RepID=A0AA88AQD8_FICCA|nr:hypothetical protein TIFTF001_017226 [Ficus carica]